MDFFTKSTFHYSLFSGKSDVDVTTIRFNLNSPTYNHGRMIDTLITQIMNLYPLNSSCLGRIDYDLLLVSNSDPPSFYIFTANSNQRILSTSNEATFILNQDQLFTFVSRATPINIPELEIDFQTSNMSISSVLSIVYTFYQTWKYVLGKNGSTQKRRRKNPAPKKNPKKSPQNSAATPSPDPTPIKKRKIENKKTESPTPETSTPPPTPHVLDSILPSKPTAVVKPKEKKTDTTLAFISNIVESVLKKQIEKLSKK